MDLFEAFPQLAGSDVTALRERTLRLIAVAGFVYDEQSYYFELGLPRFWGRLPSGGASIGIGTAKVQPDGTLPLHHALIRHLRKEWRLQVDLYPSSHSYLLDESGGIHILSDVAAHIPYLFVFTPPRLGGGEVPDALVQAVYLLPIRRVGPVSASVGILRVARSALVDLLAPESWHMQDISVQPWAEFLVREPLPADARLQPVLALKGLRNLIVGGALPGPLTN